MDSSTTKVKPQELHKTSAVKHDEITLSETLSKLPETNQSQQSNNEDAMDERKKNFEETVTVLHTATTSVTSDALELGSNDEGLIVIQTDVKQVESVAACVSAEEKPVTRTKLVYFIDYKFTNFNLGILK